MSTTYDEIPDVEADAVVDPHYLELRGSSPLPLVYMPPAMAGAHAHSPLLRSVALILIAVFVAATAAGICLTYGPPSHLF